MIEVTTQLCKEDEPNLRREEVVSSSIGKTTCEKNHTVRAAEPSYRNTILVNRDEYIDANFRAAVLWPVDFHADKQNNAPRHLSFQVSTHVDNLWTF